MGCPVIGLEHKQEIEMGIEVPTESRTCVIAGQGQPYTVVIRRDIGREVRPEAEQVDGKVFVFRFGWMQDDGDPYPDEAAMIPNDFDWPADAPMWIASGDLLPLPDNAGDKRGA